MFFVRALFGGVTFLLLGATLAGLVLPRVIHVERSMEIAAPADQIFPYINSQRLFVSWSPWSKRDMTASYVLEGDETGAGSILRWQSSRPEIMSGSQQIVETRQNAVVRHVLNFEGLGEAQSLFQLQPAGSKTLVSGRFAADLGPNPYMRLLGIMLEERISADLHRGLWFLRDEVERQMARQARNAERAPGLASAALAPAGATGLALQ